MTFAMNPRTAPSTVLIKFDQKLITDATRFDTAATTPATSEPKKPMIEPMNAPTAAITVEIIVAKNETIAATNPPTMPMIVATKLIIDPARLANPPTTVAIVEMIGPTIDTIADTRATMI